MTRMFLVNIPFMFAAVWKVLQMFVDDRVKAKIRFLRKADFHILHEFVDRSILPESLGGTVKGKVLSDKQGKLQSMEQTGTFCAICYVVEQCWCIRLCIQLAYPCAWYTVYQPLTAQFQVILCTYGKDSGNKMCCL